MIPFNSFSDVQNALKISKYSCFDITKEYLKRISDSEKINAFIEVYDNESLSRAKIIDQKLKKGQAGRLAGMVLAIKDNICYKNHKV